MKGIKADCNKKHIKRSSGDQLNPAKRKKVVSTASFTADRQTKVEKNCYDLESISNDIRKRIVKWQRRQNDDAVTKLREHTHYKVNCRLDSSGCLDVHVSCEICNKKYKLHHKNEACGSSVIMISNWTGHIKKCIKDREVSQKQTSKGKQATISKFVSVIPTSSNCPGSPSDDCTKLSASAVTTINSQEQTGNCCLEVHSDTESSVEIVKAISGEQNQQLHSEESDVLSTMTSMETMDSSIQQDFQ